MTVFTCQLDCSNFKSKMLLIHCANLQWTALLIGPYFHGFQNQSASFLQLAGGPEGTEELVVRAWSDLSLLLWGTVQKYSQKEKLLQALVALTKYFLPLTIFFKLTITENFEGRLSFGWIVIQPPVHLVAGLSLVLMLSFSWAAAPEKCLRFFFFKKAPKL